MDLILEMPEKVTSENIEDLITKEVDEQLEALDEEGFDDWLDEIDDLGRIPEKKLFKMISGD